MALACVKLQTSLDSIEWVEQSLSQKQSKSRSSEPQAELNDNRHLVELVENDFILVKNCLIQEFEGGDLHDRVRHLRDDSSAVSLVKHGQIPLLSNLPVLNL